MILSDRRAVDITGRERESRRRDGVEDYNVDTIVEIDWRRYCKYGATRRVLRIFEWSLEILFSKGNLSFRDGSSSSPPLCFVVGSSEVI